MEPVLSIIVAVVATILGLVLFFKLWIMTNDVRELRNRYVFSLDFPIEIRKCLLSGKKDYAKELIITRFVDKIKNLDYEGIDEEYFEKAKENIDYEFEQAKKELEMCFSKIGEELPDEIKKLNTVDDFCRLF